MITPKAEETLQVYKWLAFAGIAVGIALAIGEAWIW